MNLSIPYANRVIDLEIEDRFSVDVLAPAVSSPGDAHTIIRDAISEPMGGPSFHDFLSQSGSLLVIVNDADRNTPTQQVLDVIGEDLLNAKAQVIVASGSHPKPSTDDLEFIFGKHLDGWRDRILFHNARDLVTLVSVGTTSRGTEVAYNRAVTEADRILIIGSVEPHYFAGFTGGRKGFFPGVAAYESIEQNHKLALESGVAVMALEGNPVHEDMVEAAGLLSGKSIFTMMAVLDPEDCLVSVRAGGMQAAFDAAVLDAKSVFSIPVQSTYDIVVAIVNPPLDKNLYQAHKGIENARQIVRPGGILILVAACQNGLGNDTFVRLLSQSGNPSQVLARIESSYKLGYHKAARIARHVQEIEIWAVTELSPEIPQSVFMRGWTDLQSAVDAACTAKPEGKIAIVQNAGVVVPGRESPS